MSRPTLTPTGRERHFDDDEIIVSKTDKKGQITYANEVFQRLSGYTEAELLGAPHNLIRHPGMPRCVFQLLWDRISEGHEVFAYVINLCKTGDHYWVLAHVTPSFDPDGEIIGYHSNRRVPDREAIDQIAPLYERLQKEETSFASPKEGLEASNRLLTEILAQAGVTYDEFVWSLQGDA